MSAVVTLKKGEGRTIKAGGAWIFDNEIDTVMGSFENGEIVVRGCSRPSRNPPSHRF